MKRELSSEGVLWHGRHLRAENWEQLIVGDPATQRLGSGLVVARFLLDHYDQDIVVITGTGASTRNGLYESEFTKQFFLKEVSDGVLDHFEAIHEHPYYQTRQHRIALFDRLEDIITQTDTKDTKQEISEAAKTFTEYNVERVT